MSLLRCIERATTRSKTPYDITYSSVFAFLCPALQDEHVTTERRPRRRPRPQPCCTAAETEKTFISSLVQAGSCREHQLMGQKRARVRQERGEVRQRRNIHTRPTQAVREPASAAATITKEDLHDLVDIYETRHSPSPKESQDAHTWWEEEDSFLSDGVPIGPEALDKPWDESYFTTNAYLASPEGEPWSDAAQIVNTLDALLSNQDTPHEELYLLYKTLPGNRVPYIPPSTLFKLINTLSAVPSSRFQKSYADNYLSLLYDMRAENMPIPVSLWTTAIRFLGLAEGERQAVRLWREMEEHYQLRATYKTFSVLFDLALKNQNFALAEMVEKEARARRVRLDRVSRMGRIFYHGLLGDGAGVRTAYARLVDAGEIVDTAVLTCVITALLDSGEYPAALETFSRMKALHTSKQGATSAPHDWRHRRDLRTLLTDAAHRYRSPERALDRKRFQDAAPVNPDWRTYRAFIAYHVRVSGSYADIETLLLEMKRQNIPLNRELYRTLFHGFAKHGGISVVSWNARNLETVWRSFERSVVKRPDEFAYDGKLVIAAVKAFAFVVNGQRAREVWERIRERWVVEASVEGYVERMLERRSRKRRSWQGG